MHGVESVAATWKPTVVRSRVDASSAPALLASYFETLDSGLVLIDGSGRIAFATAQACLLLGCARDVSLVGRLASPMVRRVAWRPGAPHGPVLDGLRRLLMKRQAFTQHVVVAGATLTATMRPLGEAGWALDIRDVAEPAIAPTDSRDVLTGLADRAVIDARLAHATLHGTAFALFAVDLDRFKHVNDTLGHPIGDALLCKVAERLRSVAGPADCVARLGGDEFVVMRAEGADADSTARLARRIVDLVGRAYVVDGHIVHIGASVGVALAPHDSNDPSRLMKFADLALYRAKAEGRDTFRFFEPAMDERMQIRRRLELDLRKALALREFELVYQPQLNLESGQFSGCEALIRWRHPVRGLVSPADFIPVAEEIGLIAPIGEWVLRTACREASRWPGALSVSVNLSPAQFKNRRLVEEVESALSASGLDPRRLELEITEGLLLNENEANLEILHRLRSLGLRISLDDFGTGYASLSYLRSFPFDKIKIDRSFVNSLGTKPDGAALVRAIAGLGQSLKMTTVAEGVETAEQLDGIRAEGCTDVQGYLISRPIAACDAMALFSEQFTLSSRLSPVSAPV